MLKGRYQILLICVMVLGVYYISIFAEINSLDDQAMINGLINSSGVSLKGLFLPNSEEGLYYRPIIGLSYELDRFVSFADQRFMHFHNIILHLVNVFLVFWLARLLLRPENRRKSLLPLVSALCFGLHPIVTESVNWISGRTDVLAGTFVLLSAIFLMKFRENRSLPLLLAAIVAVFFGILTKETAFGFLFGAALLLSARSEQFSDTDDDRSFQKTTLAKSPVIFSIFAAFGIATAIISSNYWLVLVEGILYFLVIDFQKVQKKGVAASTRKYLRHAISIVLVTGTSIGFFFLMRTFVFASSTSRIFRTLELIFQDPNYAFSVFLGAFGFYVKKFFYPFPQSFAIGEIDPFYPLLGVFLFFGCIFLLQRRTVSNALLLSGVFLLLPVFLIAFGTIAWTGYAERYVYMSAAFWSVVVCQYVAEKMKENHVSERYQVAGVVLFMVILGVVTYQRNIVWNTNLTLYADTVKKNPVLKTARNGYMLALIKEKNYTEAIRQYQAASSIFTIEYHEDLDLNMAKILVAEGKYDKALSLFELCVKKGGGKSIRAYEKLIEYLQERIVATEDSPKKKVLQKKLLMYSEKLYALNHSPLTAYRTGQVALTLRDKKIALHYFILARNGFDDQNIYKSISEKIITSLMDQRS